jgi:hypothetical protein
MITIDNTKVKSEQAGKEVTFCDYLLQIAKHIPYQQGLTRENIKLELKVIDSLESQKEKEQLSIDDSYVQYLKEKELNMTWIIREKWLVEFGETLQNIKT